MFRWIGKLITGVEIEKAGIYLVDDEDYSEEGRKRWRENRQRMIEAREKLGWKEVRCGKFWANICMERRTKISRLSLFKRSKVVSPV